MFEPNHYGSFKEQMQRFRASDEAREQFVSVCRAIAPAPCPRPYPYPSLLRAGKQELVAKYEALSDQYSELKSDYLSERDNRRNYQKTLEEKLALVADCERQLVGCNISLA